MSKKEKAVVIATATLLSITSSLSTGVHLYAQESKSDNKETATIPERPQSLTGIEGQQLQDIDLPAGWSWSDSSTILHRDTSQYMAAYMVKDTGAADYQAESHVIETALRVSVHERIADEALNTYTTRAGDVMLDVTNFPDTAFRNYITNSFDANTDGRLDSNEVNDVQVINVGMNTAITDLKGIEFFTELKELHCFGTDISSLNIRANTALTKLDCKGTSIASLNVTDNINLETLLISDTDISTLDVTQNLNLKALYSSGTNITTLNVGSNHELQELNCYDTDITNLDVSGNLKLTYLNCSETKLTSLNIRQNTKLQNLNLQSTKGINVLDVTQNTELKILNCQGTGVSTLLLNTNSALQEINCSDTAITSLDVSGNTALTLLNVSKNPLAYLNVGTNSNLVVTKENVKAIDLDVSGSTFQIDNYFAGIDLAKITVTHGAIFNRTTGVMSGYTIDTPILYTYDCGITSAGNEMIDVSVTPKYTTKTNPTITMNKLLDNVYDGKRVGVADRDITTDSTGAKTYLWEMWNDGEWTQLSEAPSNAGKYRITINIAATDYHNRAEKTVEFTITKAEAGITLGTTLDKTYDGSRISVAGQDVVTDSPGGKSYTWEMWHDGMWEMLSEAPVNAGTYRLKVQVAETINHMVAKYEQEFVIAKAESTMKLNKDLNKTYDDAFVILTDDDLRITGSTGAISYQWEMKQDGQWIACGVPKNEGIYRVQIGVAEDENFRAVTTLFSFSIKSAGGEGNVPGIEPGEMPGEDSENLTAINTEQPMTKVDTTVKTGDNQRTRIFGMLSVLSLGILGWLAIRKKQDTIEESCE